ncbi:MAG: SsrA-binding protein SmpB [Patescibacteria group bacterium]|nr:SsrA-binding protein SmpB [Patescibacteria group bacterium]MDE2588768.1 SsrA-binding protein SmpB [Patescibacteria group bacterium]
MKITNRRAFADYELFERIEAGINLLGAEVKAIKLGHADITGSHVRITGSEAYLIGSKIYPYKYARPESYDENRTRKLLLHKKELMVLKSKTDGQNLTIVPLSLYTKGGFVKVELALGKGKKEYEKRTAIKKREQQRQEAANGLEEFGY